MYNHDSESLYAKDEGMSYKLMTLPDFRHFRDMALGQSPQWKKRYEDKLTRVESRDPDDDSTTVDIIRVQRVMPEVPPQVLYDQLHDSTYRATWDDRMIEGFNIVQLDKHNDIGYYSVKFPWPLANRDFCNQRSWMEFTNGEFVIFNHSVPHNRCPVKSNFVRGKSILTGYFIQPYDGGKGSTLTYITHGDPCGSIPHSILNFVMKTFAPNLLNTCEKCSLEYPAFAAKMYPPGHVQPWRTPPMDWNSKYHYPEDEIKARAETAVRAVERAAGDTGLTSGEASAASDAGGTVAAPLTNVSTSPIPAAGGVSNAPLVSLAPVAPMRGEHGLALQQYRAILQDAMNSVDRSFLQEGRAPSTREYVVRLKYVIEGIRRTSAMA